MLITISDQFFLIDTFLIRRKGSIFCFISLVNYFTFKNDVIMMHRLSTMILTSSFLLNLEYARVFTQNPITSLHTIKLQS